MQEPYYWYILYVRTNAEKRVIGDIEQFVEAHSFPYEFDAFCPESEVYYRNKKERAQGRLYKRRPLFPSYVFLETDMPPEEFISAFGSFFYGSTAVVRLLKSGDNGIALPAEERHRLEYLLRGKRCLTHSVGVIVGEQIIINEGPLKGFEGYITRINRHNRYADIDVDMFGGKIKAQVALEIVEKRDS